MREDLLTVEELAQRLKVPVSTVYAWRYRGTGPRGMRIGRHVRYAEADVDTWLKQRQDIRTA